MKQILEYIISKNSKVIKNEKPKYNCSIEELEKWLNSYDVTNKVYFQNGKDWKPELKKIGYEIGPCYGPGSTWIRLESHPNKNIIQFLIIKPKAQSMFKSKINGNYVMISFDHAIEIAIEMINNPEKQINNVKADS